MEYRIVYQETPYNYTMPRVIIVRADSKTDAMLLAIDRLSRAGHYVSTYTFSPLDGKPVWASYLKQEVFSEEELEELVERGVKPAPGAKTHFRRFEEHNLDLS